MLSGEFPPGEFPLPSDRLGLGLGLGLLTGGIFRGGGGGGGIRLDPLLITLNIS